MPTRRKNRDLMSSRFRCGLSKGSSMNDLLKQVSRGIAAAMLTAAPVFAQTIAAKPSGTAKPQAVSTAREASSGMATGREAQSGMATGRRTVEAPSDAASTAKNSGHATETVEYKDPEDMTTRHRPGNNKTTKTALGSDTSSGASAAAHATAKEAGLPACDGASKDAAKCSAAPASGSQAATRVNKVESFTVKQ